MFLSLNPLIPHLMYTGKELCVAVLKKVGRPMTAEEIWDFAKKNGMDKDTNLNGKRPWMTISAQMYVDIKERPGSQFLLTKPGTFYLKGLAYDNASESAQPTKNDNKEKEDETHKEIKLHPFLASFVRSDPHFYCYTKTIKAPSTSRSSRYKNRDTWRYPDIVGVHFVFEDPGSTRESFGLFKTMGQSLATIFSFELKTNITKNNVRECYFQAISNSSWANEGYLVAERIDDEALEELRSLNKSFGIGVILLNVDNVNESEILLQSSFNEYLDYGSIHKLSENADFKAFIDRVSKDINNEEATVEKYEQIKDRDELVGTYKRK